MSELTEQEKKIISTCWAIITHEIEVLRRINPSFPYLMLTIIIEKELTMTTGHILEIIDFETAPNLMSKAKALDFLTELRDQLTSRIEALREETANEEQESKDRDPV